MNARILALCAGVALVAIPQAVSAHCGSCGVGGEDHDDHASAEKADKPAEMAVPEGAKVMFVAPADGATLTSPVNCRLQLVSGLR